MDSADAADDDPRLGLVLDERYRVVAPLAEGGMGTVYRGERVNLGRAVAIKFLHAWAAADPSFIKRFEVEARAMARLQHPACASVIDFGIAGHEPYVVMDLVSGVSLRKLLDDRGELPPARAVDIARQMLAGLAHAHRQGIIHRDVKPENIMVDATELGDEVRVLDFGLAKVTQMAGDLTGGLVVGTPSYMSPEQSRGDLIDARADVYAVGVVLFEMMTGENPFLGDDAGETMRRHRELPAPRLVERGPRGTVFPPELEAVVARALAKAPADRYTAAELAVALDEVPLTPSRLASAAPVAEPPPVRETMTLDAADLLPVTTAHVAQPSAVHAPTPPPPAPVPPPVAWSDVPPTRVAPPPAPSGSFAHLIARARARWWLVGAGALALLALIAVIAIVAGGDASGGATPADAGVPDEIEMSDEGKATPPELAGLRAKVRGADTAQAVVTSLHRLGTQYPGNPEIPALLAQIYFARLWVDDALEQARKAIRLDPALREDETLIRAALTGLGNDGHHAKVRRFLAKDIGPAAVPYLQAVLDGNWRKEVKERATATLGDIGP